MSRAEITARILLSSPDRPDVSCFKFFKDVPFRWTSGTLHPVYTDNRLFQSLPIAREQITDYLVKEIEEREIDFDTLAAVFSSGIYHADGIARRLKKPMITVRPEPKNHGAGSTIDGILDPGGKCLPIEDLFSTGGSTEKVVTNIRKEGGVVTHVLSIVTYGWPDTYRRFQEANLIPISLTDFPTILRKAIELGQVDERMKSVIEDWQHDPMGWAKRHGFE